MPRRHGQYSVLKCSAVFWPDVSSKELYAAIMCGEIRVNGQVIKDPKAWIDSNARLDWNKPRFVGRGGFKLDGVLDEMQFDPKGMVCLDAGSSTGGFTDCLLQRDASHVHAVEVGINQLAWKLRNDARVSVHEKTNIMTLVQGDFSPPVQMAVADLSFRSLRRAAAHILHLVSGGPLLALIKPQYENPLEENFDGVVRSSAIRAEAVRKLVFDLKKEGVFVHDALVSSVSGRKGNIEIFVLLWNKPALDDSYIERRLDQSLRA